MSSILWTGLIWLNLFLASETLRVGNETTTSLPTTTTPEVSCPGQENSWQIKESENKMSYSKNDRGRKMSMMVEGGGKEEKREFTKN